MTNENIKLTPKIIDLERAIEDLKIPGLYRFFGVSLEVGREARLLETIRGQGEIDKNRLYDFSSEFGYNPDYVETILIPKFVDWGFLVDSEKSIDITINSQRDILGRCGEEWIKKKKDPRDSAAIKIISALSRRPMHEDELKGILKEYDANSAQDSILTLEAIKQISELNIDNQKIYFSPSMVGDNIEAVKGLFSQKTKGNDIVADSIYEKISEYQGYPMIGLPKAIGSTLPSDLMDSLQICGGLDPCEVSSGRKQQTFLFTGDVFSKENDPYHFVKETTSHFRFAEHFANYRLLWLPKFIRSLIENGEAGRASPIGTDYKLLERRGIIEVKPLDVSGKYRMYLIPGKEDVLKKTLDLIETNVKPIIPLERLPLKEQLERIRVPPEARTNIDIKKVNDLVTNFVERLRRAR
jgi:hypothetical protein